MKNPKPKALQSKNILILSFNMGLKFSRIKTMITVIFLLLFFNSYSQEKNYIKLPEKENNCPTIIINETIISNENFINSHKPLINKMSVMKEKPNPRDHTFYNLSENGIVLVQMDKKIKTKTQYELNRFFRIHKKNKIYINGYLIENSKYKIATESIIEIELIQPNSTNKLTGKSINVWTLTKEERKNNCNK
ncbi:MAG: hypothetical protein AB8B65_15300 [Kordia sp.]|uniref:hypothetical protein n=1 Tax=Kordia sp. TaxID=1965332 RepID=UPI00385982CB